MCYLALAMMTLKTLESAECLFWFSCLSLCHITTCAQPDHTINQCTHSTKP